MSQLVFLIFPAKSNFVLMKISYLSFHVDDLIPVERKHGILLSLLQTFQTAIACLSIYVYVCLHLR